MLEEKIAELKTKKSARIIPRIDLDIPTSLDDTLFLSETDKLHFYREIESVETLLELDTIE